MADNRQKSYDLDSKWDACLDLSLRRVIYSSLACGAAGILLLRSPVTRWASVAFGAGLGLGSAYSDCSQLFNRPASSATFTPSSISQPSQATNVLVSEDAHS